jgi:hypothetical protein
MAGHGRQQLRFTVRASTRLKLLERDATAIDDIARSAE